MRTDNNSEAPPGPCCFSRCRRDRARERLPLSRRWNIPHYLRLCSCLLSVCTPSPALLARLAGTAQPRGSVACAAATWPSSRRARFAADTNALWPRGLDRSGLSTRLKASAQARACIATPSRSRASSPWRRAPRTPPTCVPRTMSRVGLAAEM